MDLAQRLIAGSFAAFLWLIAFGAMTSITQDQQWLAFASLLIGMALVLWAFRPIQSR